MATAILRSQGVLGDRSLQSSNPNPRMNNASRCHRRKQRDGSRRWNQNNISISSSPAKSLVMGQVKILKRGEELNPNIFNDLDLYSTDRLGPDPQVLQKHIRVPDLYAGPTSLVSSPPPSYLPFPAALIPPRNNI